MLKHYYEAPEKYIDYHYNIESINTSVTGPYHFHFRYEIYYFISGNAKYFIDDKTYILNPRNLLLINDRQIHRVMLNPGTDYERIAIHFDPHLIRLVTHPDLNLLKCFEDKSNSASDLLDLSDDKEFNDMILKYNTRHLSDSPENATLGLTKLIELLILINHHYLNDTTIRPIEDTGRISPILEYINNNLHEQITLDSLGQLFYINKYYLSRLFKKSTSYTFHEHLTLRRIIAAKELIQKGAPLSEICERIGFNSYSCFYRAFKQLTNLSPREYVESIKNLHK